MALADKIIEQSALAIFKGAMNLSDGEEDAVAQQRREHPKEWLCAETAAREAFEKAIQPPIRRDEHEFRQMFPAC